MSIRKTLITGLIIGLILGGVVAYLGATLNHLSQQETYENTITLLQQQNADLESNITDVETQLASLELLKTVLQGNLTYAQGLITELETQLSDQVQRNVDLQQTLADTLNVTITHQYRWTFESTTFQWNLSAPLSVFVEYATRPRPPTSEWVSMALDPQDDKYLDQILHQLDTGASQARLSPRDKATFVGAFIQSLANTENDVPCHSDEYPQYPLETLWHHGGDAEDNAILVASLLDAWGYNTALLRFSANDHVAVGVDVDGATGAFYDYKGKRYYYLETTGSNWALGELPTMPDPTAYVYPVESPTKELITGGRDGEVIVWKYIDGTFERIWSTQLSHGVCDIEIGDVNNDDVNEFVVSTNARTGAGVHLFENRSGTFVETWNDTTTFSTSVNGLAIGDVDNDGLKELVVSDYWATTKVFKYNSGTYEVVGNIDFYYGGSVNDVIVADSDNDGDNELLIARSYNVLHQHYRRVEVFEYASETIINVANEYDAENFVNVAVIATPSVVDSIDVADTDGDTRNEVLVSGFFDFLQLYKYQNGEYVNVWNSADMGGIFGELDNVFQDSEIGDVTNNGRNNIVGHLYTSLQSGNPGQTMIWEWNGSAYANTVNVTHSAGQGSMHVVSIGDVDGDGKNEWSVNEGTTVSLCRIDGTIVTNVWGSDIGESPHAEIGDVDNDTRPLHANPMFSN